MRILVLSLLAAILFAPAAVAAYHPFDELPPPYDQTITAEWIKTPLETVLSEVSAKTGLTFTCAPGFWGDIPVTLSVSSMRTNDVLDWISHLTNSTWLPQRNNVVLFGTRESLGRDARPTTTGPSGLHLEAFYGKPGREAYETIRDAFKKRYSVRFVNADMNEVDKRISNLMKCKIPPYRSLTGSVTLTLTDVPLSQILFWSAAQAGKQWDLANGSDSSTLLFRELPQTVPEGYDAWAMLPPPSSALTSRLAQTLEQSESFENATLEDAAHIVREHVKLNVILYRVPSETSLTLQAAPTDTQKALLAGIARESGLSLTLTGDIAVFHPEDARLPLDPLRVIPYTTGLNAARLSPDEWSPILEKLRSTRLTFTFHGTSLKDAVKTIAREAQVGFVFMRGVPVDKRVDIHLHDMPADEALYLLSAAAGVQLDLMPLLAVKPLDTNRVVAPLAEARAMLPPASESLTACLIETDKTEAGNNTPDSILLRLATDHQFSLVTALPHQTHITPINHSIKPNQITEDVLQVVASTAKLELIRTGTGIIAVPEKTQLPLDPFRFVTADPPARDTDEPIEPVILEGEQAETSNIELEEETVELEEIDIEINQPVELPW